MSARRDDEQGGGSGALAGSAISAAPASALAERETPHDQLGAAFKRAMVAVRRLRGRETHRPEQISYAQYGLLFSLAGMCERSSRELADHAGLTAATVTQMLDSLEAQGFVTRTRSGEDRRVVLSSLTERGERLIAERHAQMEPRWRAALHEFDDTELVIAARVLNRLADYFDALLDRADDAGSTPRTLARDDPPGARRPLGLQ